MVTALFPWDSMYMDMGVGPSLGEQLKSSSSLQVQFDCVVQGTSTAGMQLGKE